VSTTEVLQLKDLLEAHGRVLSSIQSDQKDIMYLLRGNPMDPYDTGLLGRIEDMEGEINSVKTELQKHRELGQKVVWIGAGAMGVLSFVVGVVAWAADLIFK
jgi:hypothetical protein